MNKKIYLAIPYSGIGEKSFYFANKVSAYLMLKGYVVFSPISHSHPIAIQESLPKGFDFWEKFDKAFIEWCDILFVVCIDGWDKSTGVKKEIEIAKKLNKRIIYIRCALQVI